MSKFALKLLMATSLCFGIIACNSVEPSDDTQSTKVGPAKNDPPPGFSDAAEAQYLKRLNKQATGDNAVAGAVLENFGYDTVQDVPGAPSAKYLPLAKAKTISAQAITKADDYAGKMDSYGLLIWRGGALEHEAYYDGYDRDKLMNSKSLAKPLGVVAVGRALQEGHIKSLDQSLSDYITEWTDTPKAAITIRHILNMTDGLLPQGEAKGPDDPLNRAYLHPHHDEVIIHEYPLTHEPGTRYEYANAASELVAVLIERATGQPYEDWLSAQVFTPLEAAGGKIWMNREGGTPHSGCCALLPAQSFMKLAILYLQDGIWDGTRLLPEGFVDQVKKTSASNPHAGMGAYIAGDYVERRGAMHPDLPFGQNYHSAPYLADDLFLFDGNSHQVAYIIPSADMVIFRTGEWGPKEPEWDNSYLPNVILSGIDFAPGLKPSPQKRAK